MSSKYTVDVINNNMSEASHAPVNRFGKQAGKLEVNNFVLEQLRTSPKLLQTIIERKVQEHENVNENVPLFNHAKNWST